MATRPRRNDQQQVAASPILFMLAFLSLALEIWHLPGVLVCWMFCAIAAVPSIARSGLPYKDGKDPWGAPWPKGAGPEGDKGDRTRRRRMGWSANLTKGWNTPKPILALAVGLAFAQVGQNVWESVCGLLGGFLLTWSFLHRLDARSVAVACGRRPVKMAIKQQWKKMLIGAGIGLIPAIPVAALGWWSLAASLPLIGLVAPYLPQYMATRRQYKLDRKAAQILWESAWSAGKSWPAKPGMVTNTKVGKDGSMIFSMATSSPISWCNGPQVTNAFDEALSASQQVGAFVLDGANTHRVEVAIAPAEATPAADLDMVGVTAACEVETARLAYQYASRPGACKLTAIGHDKAGHTAAWKMKVLANGNIDWSEARADWLGRGTATGQFAVWGKPRGLSMLVNPAGDLCWVWAGDRSQITFGKANPRDMDSRLAAGNLGDYLNNIARWQADANKMDNALTGAKLPTFTTWLYMRAQNWDSKQGWKLTSVPVGIASKAGVDSFAYEKVDLRAALGNATIAQIVPLPVPGNDNAYSAWAQVVRTEPAFCGAPTKMGELPRTLGDPGLTRALAHVMVIRALAAVLKIPPVVGMPMQCSNTDNWSLWRIHVGLRGGVTVADLRRKTDNIAAILGGKTLIWQWVGDTQAYLWAGDKPSMDPNQWVDPDLYGIMQNLLLDQAWATAGIVTKAGQTPTLRERKKEGPLTRLVFDLPVGITADTALDRLDAFSAAAGLAWVKPASDPTGIAVLASRKDPLPSIARADWSVTAPDPGLPFGILDDGSTAVWSIKNTPHLLASGTTGSGKSSVSLTLSIQALRHGWILVAADPSKGLNDFRPIRDWCTLFGDTLEGTVAMMDWAVDEMRRRVKMIAKNGGGDLSDLPDDVRPPRMLVFMDELNSLLMRSSQKIANPSGDPAIENQNIKSAYQDRLRKRIAIDLSILLTQARSAQIAVLLGAQHLAAGSLQLMPNASTALQMLGHIFLGVGDAQGNVTAPNVKAANHMIRTAARAGFPKGRGLYETLGGNLQMLQAWWPGSGNELQAALTNVPKPTGHPDMTSYMPAPPELAGMIHDEPQEIQQTDQQQDQQGSQQDQNFSGDLSALL